MTWIRNGGGVRLGMMICLALASGACSTASVQPQRAARVVLMWLKHPNSTGDRAQLIRAANSLRMIPGVTRIETGRTAPLPATVTDRSFDLAVTIIFRDRAALQRFEGDPRRASAMERYLRPLVSRYAVYDVGGR